MPRHLVRWLVLVCVCCALSGGVGVALADGKKPPATATPKEAPVNANPNKTAPTTPAGLPIPNCPTVDQLPGEITAAKDLLQNGLQAAALPPPAPAAVNAVAPAAVPAPPPVPAPAPAGTDIINGVVQFVATRANQEVESWLMNSVVDSICTRDPTDKFFPNSCQIYNKTSGARNPSLMVGLNALVSTLRTDATYAPACLFYRQVYQKVDGKAFASPETAVKDIAALGYYYIAVATGNKTTVSLPKNVNVTLVNNILTVTVDTTSFSIPGDSQAVETFYDVWTAVHAAEQKDYALAFTMVADALTGDSANVKVSPALQQALETAIALASATDADSVQSILDQVASPVGAWAVKQQSSVVSITSLPGIEAGQDRLTQAGNGTRATTYGFFLPLGAEYSHPLLGGAVNLLLSPVDAGGLLSYAESKSTSNGKVQSAPTVTWKSIVAPGAYVAYSFHRSPFVLGVGYQRSPNLRSVALTNGTTTQVPADRILLFFTVDVTLFMHAF